MSAIRAIPDDRFEEILEVANRLLAAVGEDPTRDGLADTPRRIAEALSFLTDGYRVDPRAVVRRALFEHDGDEPVTVRDIPVYGLCEHHLLPMFGRCHIGYVPNGRVIGLSKLPRLVNVFAHRLQLQERLTRDIAHAIEEVAGARGVAVVIEARHMCIEMRGVEKADSETLTSCILGEYRSNPALRAEFMELTQRGRR